jgi:hypothetical protein
MSQVRPHQTRHDRLTFPTGLRSHLQQNPGHHWDDNEFSGLHRRKVSALVFSINLTYLLHQIEGVVRTIAGSTFAEVGPFSCYRPWPKAMHH